MKQIYNYIFEKLHLDKNIDTNTSSIHCDIYNVHVGDKVLGICSSPKTNSSYLLVL